MAETHDQNSFLDYAGLALFWNKIKKIIENNELVTATALTDLDTRVDDLESGTMAPIILTTYSELKSLRDNSQLIPGQQYRITDYQTVSNQENTDADGRRFDIIVTADDVNVLNENARAIHHEGCDDFKDDNLAAWELKYTLTNDDYLYHWGNSGDRIESIYEEFYKEFYILSVNGDKIEYGYEDEGSYGEYTIDKSKTHNIQGNEYYRTIESEYYYVPVNYSVGDPVYYFDECINIYPSFIITDKLITLCGDNYYQLDKYRDCYVSTEYNNSSDIYSYCREFWEEYEILSINGDKIEYGYDVEDPYGEYTIDKSKTYNIEDNEYYKIIGGGYYYVPVNYSVGDSVYYYVEYMWDAYNITNLVNTPSTTGTIYYMKDEHNNECSYDFKCIRFSKGTDYIYTFGDGCYDNCINPCKINTFTYELNRITFGNNCYANSFGNNCYNNSFGNSCYNNSFGNNCYNNSFGYNCYDNSFGNVCYSNSFGNNCYDNSFGNACRSNSFGNYFSCNSFGNYCYYNSFRLSASYDGTLLSYCFYNHFDDGCSYNIVYSTTQGTYNKFTRNYNINRGVSGTYDKPMLIDAQYRNAENVCNVYKKGDVAVVAYIQY